MENKQKQYNLDSVFTYNKLAEALNMVGYKEVGEYVSSVDGWTYFSCVWQDEYIRAKFLINKFDKVIISVAADLSAYVLEAVEAELKEVIEGTVLTLPGVIKVVKVVPNEAPEIVEVAISNMGMMEAVGGNRLDFTFLSDGIIMCANRDAAANKEEENFILIAHGDVKPVPKQFVHGTVLFHTFTDGTISSITEKQIDVIRNGFAVDRQYYVYKEEN